MAEEVAFWAEGGSPIGMGHLARTVNIAKEAARLGLEAVFFVNGDKAVTALLDREGFRFSVLPIGGKEIPEFKGRVVVIDSRKPLKDEAEALKRARRKTVIIDNLTACESADAVIIPTALHMPETEDERIFAGAGYLIIGDGFIRERERAGAKTYKKPLNVLVTMGGADPNNLTETVVDALSDVKGIEADVIIGPASRPSEGLDRIIGERPAGVRFHCGVFDLAPFMSRAHVAITAMGTTVNELMFMGVPSIIITNYREDSKDLAAFDSIGAGLSLGYFKDVKAEDIKNAVSRIGLDRTLWERMSKRAKDVTDGMGARRIAGVIASLD